MIIYMCIYIYFRVTGQNKKRWHKISTYIYIMSRVLLIYTLVIIYSIQVVDTKGVVKKIGRALSRYTPYNVISNSALTILQASETRLWLYKGMRRCVNWKNWNPKKVFLKASCILLMYDGFSYLIYVPTKKKIIL